MGCKKGQNWLNSSEGKSAASAEGKSKEKGQ